MFRPHGPSSGLYLYHDTNPIFFVNVTFEISIVLHGYVVLIFLWLRTITGKQLHIVIVLNHKNINTTYPCKTIEISKVTLTKNLD